MLLSCNIERAFSQKRLSFEPNPLKQNTYILKVWDSSVEGELLWDDAKEDAVAADNTIGFYNGHQLQLRMPSGVDFNPFKRCLSYQHLMCYVQSNKHSLLAPAAGDFASGIGNNGLNRLTVLQRGLEKEVCNEVAEEEKEKE